MPSPRTTMGRRALVLALPLLVIVAGCENSDVGTVGPATRTDAPLPTGPPPKGAKGKDGAKYSLETRGERK